MCLRFVDANLLGMLPVVPDGISVTGLPISSPLRQLLKPRAEAKPLGSESSKAEYNQVKVRLCPLLPPPNAPPRSPAGTDEAGHIPALSVHDLLICISWLVVFFRRYS